MNPHFDILVAGEINPDLILSGNVTPEFGQVEKLVDSAALTVGSSSAIFACGAARLGLKVAFTGICGADIFGRFMLDELSLRGVDVSGVIIDPLLPTGLSVILNGPLGDRAILTHPGAINRLRAEQVTPDRLQTARHLHVASYFLQTALQPGLPDLFQRAHALGLTTSLDSNWDPSGEWRDFDELLGRVDVFLPNEKETLAISGLPTAETAARALTRKCHLVAVKQGARGALACCGDELISVQAVPVQVVDTVGAGDSFDAGFLHGFLNEWSLEKTLSLAAACGSLSTRLAGGTAAQPTLAEAMGYVSSAGTGNP
ncbi:MAG: sugar kinase [Anaerolineales bacterium]|jgi:sugar/nucleoside kinase (ribokinase family)